MGRERITIGRDPRSDIRIDERWDTVSNQHAEICRQGNQLVFIDHSSNGTVINGQKIQNTTVGIYAGDKILLANVFDLEWDVINKYFPNSNRPTVTRNVRAEELSDTGRRTVQMNVTPAGGAHGRKTEQFRNDAPRQEERDYRQPEVNVNYGQANRYSQSEIDRELDRWNWGAFLCSWLWAVCNGIYWPLLILLVACIPYIGQVCGLCLCVYLGLNGSKMAWRTGRYSDFAHFKSVQRKWAIGGVIWFVLYVIACIIILNYSMAIL